MIKFCVFFDNTNRWGVIPKAKYQWEEEEDEKVLFVIIHF